jgi:hypothetical protein
MDSGDKRWIGESYVTEDTEIRVPKDARKVEFYAYEYMGMEVYKYEGQIPKSPKDWKTINTKDGLKVGDQVFVPHPININGYWIGTVKAWPSGELYVEYCDGELTSNLNFGQDDRNAWVASSFGNTAGLERFDFQ